MLACLIVAGLASCSQSKSKFGVYLERTSDIYGSYMIVGWDKQDRYIKVRVNEGPSDQMLKENFKMYDVWDLYGDSLITKYRGNE